MRENTLKQRLTAGHAAFGVMCTLSSPAVVEMLGHLGFDWILLDNEHGSITVDTAESCIAAAELTGMAPIVRPVGTRPEIIAPFLDRGAWGVQVPHVNMAEEARAVVRAVKYAPEGDRGSGDRLQSMGYTGQQAHPEVQQVMERGVKIITGAGRIAGCSCPDALVPKFLGLGVQ